MVMMKKFLFVLASLALLAGCHRTDPEDLTPAVDVTGSWELSSVTTRVSVGGEQVSVYLVFSTAGSFDIYQKIGAGRYTHFTGNYTLNKDEKLLSGNIFCSLTILRLIGPGESEYSDYSDYSENSENSEYSDYSDYSDNSVPPSSVESILLSVPEAEGDYLPNFRQGDIVILYRYPSGQEPDVRRGMVFRATIAEIHPDHRDDGQKGVAQAVVDHNGPLLHALGSGRPHVVRPDHFQHGGPGHTGQGGHRGC
jgi:hypothetical protein